MQKAGPPPPYTPESPPKYSYSESSPLLPIVTRDPLSELGEANNRKREKSCKTSLTVIAAFLTAIIILSSGISLWPIIRNGIPATRVVNFKIGIIGGGPAGIGAVQEIVVYEEKTRVGGRMVVEGTTGMKLEVEDVASGVLNGKLLSIIGGLTDVKEQKDMATESEDLRIGKVGYFNVNDIVTETYRPYATTPWKHYISLLFRYGPSVWLAPKIPTGTMKSFHTFLSTLDTIGVSSIRDLTYIMSNKFGYTPSSLPASERLKKNGIGGNYVRDILAPQVRRHTGQSIEQISDLTLSIALEQEESGSPKAVNHGFYQMVIERSLKENKATLQLGARVTQARWKKVIGDDAKWVIQWENAARIGENLGAEEFDKIIIAAPFNYTELLGKTQDGESLYPLDDDTQDIEYQPLYITFFTTSSLLTSSLKNAPSPLPAQLLPILDSRQPSTSPFNTLIELSLLRTIFPPSQSPDFNPHSPNPQNHPEYLYRLLSSHPISFTSFSSILHFPNTTKVENWNQQEIPHAYPLIQTLLPDAEQEKGSLKLGDHIWTTRGIERVLGDLVEGAWNAGRMVGGNIAEEIFEEAEGKGIKK
ncbi:putative prenylcysteine oxidase 1 precursor protein [Botrytis fragariae]|uniref:Putative prenylcysteine oxidase 1 protein n=1 Tax=Botrytis fragariae TaxID=1964551 RepID=A0A8H6AJU2_9HELO|nr:putative prenylcysteine oxidase 1 precursor protein [Botrytis fragariae]KAF5868722.1 putative prenylcysteine oxidase 1 precursor protein [Botrytis fragariae]